jgi:hypothetical protein
MERRDSCQPFGFLSPASDQRGCPPWLALSVAGDEGIRTEAQWAVIGLAQSVGRTVLLEELECAVTGHSHKAATTSDEIVDQNLLHSGNEARKHFASFHERDDLSLPDRFLRQNTLRLKPGILPL